MLSRKIVFVSCLILSACNTPPHRIAPIPVANESYSQQDCKKLQQQLTQLDSIIATQRNQLQVDSNIDMAIVASSLVIFPLGLMALAATGNADLKNQYAQNLGKQTALKEALNSQSCED